MTGAVKLNAAAPFLLLALAVNTATAAENPVTVESLDTSGAPVPEVTEMVPFEPVVEEETPPPMPGGMEGQYQLQLLQQEVMELRGQVEELNAELARMRATQEDRYLELDRRLQSLGQGASQPINPVSISEPVSPDGTTDEAVDPDAEPTGASEKTLYDTGLELIRNRQYDLAITQLQAVITQFPDGAYAANAYYWIGEVYAAKPEPDYEAARQALSQVIEFFPDHQKTPDAAFKLGKVYHLMGDCQRAEELLTQVSAAQRGKSVGKLAEAYLRDKIDCGE